MKICFHHRIRSKDGQFVHLEELTNALRRRGHEIVLAGPRAVKEQPFGAGAGIVAVLKRIVPAPLYELMELGYSLGALIRLLTTIRREQPDFIYERYNLFLPIAPVVKRLSGLPILLEVNAPLFEERSRYSGIGLKRLAQWTQRVTWQGADMVLPVTQVLADCVRAYGVPAERITVVPNGIDPARFADAPGRDDAKSALGLDGQAVMGFVGFMHEWHGLHKVVALLDRLDDTDIHLLLVGDGPARAGLEQQVACAGLSRQVTFTGTISRTALKEVLPAFDIALQPDVTQYASPLKLFEYMFFGQAIVAPDTPNIREILTHDHNALLVSPKDPDALAVALQRLCREPELRERLGQNALATLWKKELTWDHNALRVEQIGRQLLARTG